jgi:hypothetical protein
MSKINKKPAQADSRTVKTSELLPQVFNTDPNKKMLGSTLDAMTSKGQLLPFTETHGIRNASAPVNSFFKQDTDPNRRESDSNIALISKNISDEFISKVSYLDIENYFNIKGLPLKDGVHLDSDIQFLDLPINIRKFTDYQMFYWIDGDLPAIRIHADATDTGGAKYSIATDIVGKPYIDVIDDITGKTVAFKNGMLVYFTGMMDAAFVSEDPDYPRIYMITGAGSSIVLRLINSSDDRIPMGYMKKRPWDKTNPYIDPPAINWDSESWDGGKLSADVPEYVTMDRFARDNNHWSILDRWQHISTIREVADFFEIKIEELVSTENQARRPIISFYRNVKLYNWPTRTISEIKTILPGAVQDYQGKKDLMDQYGYRLVDQDRLVFEKSPGVFKANIDAAGTAQFVLVIQPTAVRDQDGAIITASSDVRFHKVIFTSGIWKFAQNKTSYNQTPLFDFVLSDGTVLSSIENIVNQGNVILGFKEGNVYDAVLSKYIDTTEIDFDLVNDQNSKSVSPNQVKFTTDVDKTVYQLGEESDVPITGPYGYLIGDTINPFYVSRKGLDATPQMQDLTYQEETGLEWSADIIPAINGFRTLHLFADSADELNMYFEVSGNRLIPFSTRKITNIGLERFIPLVSGGNFEIVCHDLPYPFSIYNIGIEDNVSRPVAIDQLLIENNGISNGVITINLQDTYDTGSEFATNPLALDQTKLLWEYNNIYRPMVVRPLEKSRFIYSAYTLDKTTPVFHDYEFTLADITLPTGEVSYFKKIMGTNSLRTKVKSGDKVCVETILPFVLSKTAPLSLTNNPLNADIADINYYAMYQHGISSVTTTPNSREFLDPSSDTYNMPFLMGSGTIAKHSNPLARAAIMATSLPFDFSEVVIKQGKHYDSFMTRLKSELHLVINKYDAAKYDTLQLLSLALESIYLNQKDNNNFWYHSNMIGWGSDYSESRITASKDQMTPLLGDLAAVSHRAGKETILHLLSEGKLLVRDVDYWLMSDYDDYYTTVKFADHLDGSDVILRQWPEQFESRIPASLVKIGLAAPYKPEIYKDTSYLNTDSYFIARHDGTRYYLEAGVTEAGSPVDHVDQLLYEFELAIWSSLSYDTLAQDHSKVYRKLPGGFRGTVNDWNEVKGISDTEMYAWMQENNLYLLENNSYDTANPFTFKYQLGSGDDFTSVSGSWRAIYRYFYDTDRPHTHPWEMLGYTLKPVWWDQHYSWTDSTKRTALERALRVGNFAAPPAVNCRPEFVRIFDTAIPEEFPVDEEGNLLPPSSLQWLNYNTSAEFSSVWKPGDYSPYEQVFLSSQRGLASLIKANYLADPVTFVNSLWVSNGVKKNEWNYSLDRDTDFWIRPGIAHAYHRQLNSDGAVNFTSGIESLLSEFCVLNNRDFKTEVVDLFNNVVANKEFLLSGFTNKNSIRIQNTSSSNQSKSLFVPEENYAVRTLKHYPEREEFYSAMRIVWTGDAWSIFGFTNEQTYFNYYLPEPNSATSAKVIGDFTIKEKVSYGKTAIKFRYGTEVTSRQAVYDIIIGYGKYLEDRGFVFEDVELGDVRNWQLSAKQFIFWSNDALQQGNYIDLNPASDGLTIYMTGSQLENLTGTNENIGQVVDRFGVPIFSKDLLVSRDNFLTIKTKNADNPIYGIKFVFVTYETVVHLDSNSIFNDVFFQPELGTTKRGFILGGKKSQDWTGAYQIPGYMFSGTDIIPNYDTMSDLGRGLLDVEKTIEDVTYVDAINSQFGLNRNPELRQLFLPQDREILFKNAITFNKGTRKVFNSLDPLTHRDQDTSTVPFEEYMVRIGEFGNTKNIEYYEFTLAADEIVKNNQVITFGDAAGADRNTLYVKDSDRSRWVHRPYAKTLRFDTDVTSFTRTEGESPLLRGDTDYIISSIDDIVHLYAEFEPLWSIPAYRTTTNYKKYEKVRWSGRCFEALTTVSPGSWQNNQDKFKQIPEPYLPNVFVEKYLMTPGSERESVVNGSWQVLQTIDREMDIVECCTGFDDTSRARVSISTPHRLKLGDVVLIVNANFQSANVDGIWTVTALETVQSVNAERSKLGLPALSNADAEEIAGKRFYIDVAISETIKTGKIFTFLPMRFDDPTVATTIIEDPVYDLRPKFSVPGIKLQPTPSGFDPVNPIIIIDDGGYIVYEVTDTVTVVKTQMFPVNSDDIEHLLIYDYASNKTLAKIELFDPKKLKIPQVFLDEIDTISRVDPAKYNRTTDEFKAVYLSSGWHEEYLGRRWWDTSSLQFADYENGSDQDRAKNWGSTMNNTAPAIYEWTKSPVPPSQWADLIKNRGMAFGVKATGVAYLDTTVDAGEYHWVEEEETVQGRSYTVYYFWVRNKDNVAKESRSSRIYSTAQLSKVVLNPSAAGFSWWAPISRHSMVIKGVENFLNNASTVVQIKKKSKGNEKHQQWFFVSENNEIQTIPEWMHIRFRDSLSAAINYKKTDTETGYGDFFITKNVPDLDNLHPYDMAGNSVRPYIQSWFLQILEARRTLFKFVNTQLINVDLINGVPGWGTRLNQTEYMWGDSIVDMTKIWRFADYFSVNYDPTRSVTYLVDSRQGIFETNAEEGEYVRVLDQLSGTDVIYEITPAGGYDVVYRKNGTIQFIDDLWKNPSAGSWDTIPWDYKPWDYDLNAQVGVIIEALRYDVYLGKYHVNYSNMMCAMLRYTLSEQTNVDWIQKSSTIEPLNLIGQSFSRPAEFERDNVTTLVSFFNSVKSYRDKIRDSNVNKAVLDPAEFGITDSHVMTVEMDNVPKSRLVDENGKYLRDINGNFIWQKDESRLSFGNSQEPNINLVGLDFVPTGWDDAAWDSMGLDPSQSEYDSKIQQIYNAFKGIPAVELQRIATGQSTGRFYHTPHGEEAIDMRASDGMFIDTTLTEFNKTVRQHYYNNNVAAFILNNDAALAHAVGSDSMHISIVDLQGNTDMSIVPDASAENPGFMWIGNELVIYFVKTDTGVTGLIRGALGTQIGGFGSHLTGSTVSFMSAANILYPYTHIQNVSGVEFFGDRLGVTLSDSANPMAMRIKN